MGNFLGKSGADVPRELQHHLQKEHGKTQAAMDAMESVDNFIQKIPPSSDLAEVQANWDTLRQFVTGAVITYMELQSIPTKQISSEPSIGSVIHHVQKVKNHVEQGLRFRDALNTASNKRKTRPSATAFTGSPDFDDGDTGLSLDSKDTKQLLDYLGQGENILTECDGVEKLLLHAGVSRSEENPQQEAKGDDKPASHSRSMVPARNPAPPIRRFREVKCFICDSSEQPVTRQFLSILEEKLKHKDVTLCSTIWQSAGPLPTATQPLLAFCFNRSRLGTDVDNFIQSVGLKGNLANVFLIILHHQAKHIRRVTPSEQLLYSYSGNTAAIVDVCFWKDEGCYDCEINDSALTRAVTFLASL